MIPHYRKILDAVLASPDSFIKWPKKKHLLFEGFVRERYHPQVSTELEIECRQLGVKIDRRSNGPAVMTFLYAGGERPLRSSRRGWSIHHVYDGCFPHESKTSSLHAVKDPLHFTQSAGLVALHPIADAIAGEFSEFAWYLRKSAFDRFGYDPDGVFRS